MDKNVNLKEENKKDKIHFNTNSNSNINYFNRNFSTKRKEK